MSDLATLEITAVAHGGEGLGRIEGQVCFVAYGLPGDRLKVRITRKTKKVLWAELVEVLEPSPHRKQADCENFGRCGVCTWGHFSYPAQAEWKQRIVQENIARIAGIECTPEWVENPDLRLGYRTRAEFHGDGNKLGFFALGSHDIVNTTNHPLCHEKLNTALQELHECNIKGAVTVTVNPEGDEVLVWTKFCQRRLKQRFPLANAPGDKVPLSRFTFDGVPIVNGAFSQNSLLLNRLLVSQTRELLGKPASVLELYCGNGNLTLTLPHRVEVVGMDHNRLAIKAARRASKREYRQGDEQAMKELINEGIWETILLDPPRAGAKALMSTLADSSANAIVYVSCDPATLARDIKTLSEQGWALKRTIAIDMFPHTAHVETVCRLER